MRHEQTQHGDINKNASSGISMGLSPGGNVKLSHVEEDEKNFATDDNHDDTEDDLGDVTDHLKWYSGICSPCSLTAH